MAARPDRRESTEVRVHAVPKDENQLVAEALVPHQFGRVAEWIRAAETGTLPMNPTGPRSKTDLDSRLRPARLSLRVAGGRIPPGRRSYVRTRSIHYSTGLGSGTPP